MSAYLIFISISLAGHDETLRTRLLEEAPLGWAAYDAAQRSLSGTVVIASKGKNLQTGRESESSTRLTVFARPGSFLVEYELIRAGESTRSASCTNPNYSFIVSWPQETDQCLLDKFGEKDNPEIAKWIRWRYSDKVHPANTCPVGLPRPLAEVINDPQFVVEKVEPSPTPNCVRLTFNYNFTFFGTPMRDWGWVDFLPENHWSLVELESDNNEGSRFHLQVKLRDDTAMGGVRLPESATHTVTTAKSQSTSTMTYNWEAKDNPESRFLLSYYGLPEPAGNEKPRRRWTWLWFTAAAIVSALVALGFFRLRRRQPPAPAA